MTNFPSFSSENMGGILPTFQFCNHTQVNTEAINNVISNQLQFTYTGLAIFDSLNFSEELKPSDGGEHYETEISGFVPKLTKEYLQLFNEMKSQRFIVKIKDNNLETRICGKTNEGMRFTFEQQTTNTPQGLNGYKFKFTLKHPQPSPFYTYVETEIS